MISALNVCFYLTGIMVYTCVYILSSSFIYCHHHSMPCTLDIYYCLFYVIYRMYFLNGAIILSLSGDHAIVICDRENMCNVPKGE